MSDKQYSDMKNNGKPMRYKKSHILGSLSISERLKELYDKKAFCGCPICPGQFGKFYDNGEWNFDFRHDNVCPISTRKWKLENPDKEFPKSDKPNCWGTCCGNRSINPDTGYIHYECTLNCPFGNGNLPEDTKNDGAACIICDREIYQNDCLHNNSIHTVECPYNKAQIKNWTQNAKEPIIRDQPHFSKTKSGKWYVIIPGKDYVNLPEDADPIDDGFHGDDGEGIPDDVRQKFNEALEEWFEYKKNEEKKIQDNVN